MRFKTLKVHKYKATKEGVYYLCNQAVGRLSPEQLIKKTNWKLGKRITCKNCRKRLYER